MSAHPPVWAQGKEGAPQGQVQYYAGIVLGIVSGLLCQHNREGNQVVSFPDPTSCEEKGLVNFGRIFDSRSMARTN